jgi:hypothetical protein
MFQSQQNSYHVIRNAILLVIVIITPQQFGTEIPHYNVENGGEKKRT